MTKILSEIKGLPFFQKPPRVLDHKKNKSKYCLYHENKGHTKCCYQLWDFIECYIKSGDLQKYVAQVNMVAIVAPQAILTILVRRIIDTIEGGSASGGHFESSKEKLCQNSLQHL